MKILIALIFLVVGGTLAWFSISKEEQSEASSHNTNSLQMLLIDDLNKAAQNKELPQYWDQLLEVRYIYHSQKVQKILSKSPIVAINKKGDKKLVVEFFDEPGAADIVMIRYNIVDVVSGNTVGEMNRRLKMPLSMFSKQSGNDGVLQPAPATGSDKK